MKFLKGSEVMKNVVIVNLGFIRNCFGRLRHSSLFLTKEEFWLKPFILAQFMA